MKMKVVFKICKEAKYFFESAFSELSIISYTVSVYIHFITQELNKFNLMPTTGEK